MIRTRPQILRYLNIPHDQHTSDMFLHRLAGNHAAVNLRALATDMNFNAYADYTDGQIEAAANLLMDTEERMREIMSRHDPVSATLHAEHDLDRIHDNRDDVLNTRAEAIDRRADGRRV